MEARSPRASVRFRETARRNVDLLPLLGLIPSFLLAIYSMTEAWAKGRVVGVFGISRSPEATLLIAGADAPAFIRRRNGREGITVVSPMEDRRALLRRVRVALFPLRHGSGQSNKVLEAGEASCALVATPQAMRGLDDLVPLAAVASTPAALAARTVELLGTAGASQESGRRLREAVEAGYSRQSACRSMAEVALGPAVGHPLSGPS